MKVLINASSIVVGGGIQVAVNLIKYTLMDEKNDYYYVLSSKVYSQLGRVLINEDNVKVFKFSPALILKGRRVRKEILKIEKQFNPEIVYSVGAPSYINFRNKEVIRLTNPWVIELNRVPLSVYNYKNRGVIILKTLIQRFYVRKEHYFITQTEIAKNKIQKTFNVKDNRVFVIPNILPKHFYEEKNKKKVENNLFSILVFSSPYPHKNLLIIPRMISILSKKTALNFRFIVTIPYDSVEWDNFKKEMEKFNVSKFVENKGYVNLNDIQELYEGAHILFLPTLLEVFSVTYLEAMSYGLPIVTTDFDFTRYVCGEDNALYFDYQKIEDAVQHIINLKSDTEFYSKMSKKSKERLEFFQKNNTDYGKHIDVLEMIVKDSRVKHRRNI